MDALQGYDLGLLYFFGSLHRPWLDRLVMTWTHLGDVVFLLPLTLVLAGRFAATGRRRAAGTLLLIGAASLAVQYGVKGLVDRPRPVVAWRLIPLPDEPSYPSGHSLSPLAVYLSAALLLARDLRRRGARMALVMAALLLGLSIGLTRPYLGVHYPLDMIAGWIAGLGVALTGVGLMGPRPHAEQARPIG